MNIERTAAEKEKRMPVWRDTEDYAYGPLWKCVGRDETFDYWVSPEGFLYRTAGGYWETLKGDQS